MNVSVDPIQNAAIQVGSFLSRLSVDPEDDSAIRSVGEEVEALNLTRPSGELSKGGVHAVREIAWAALGESDSSEHRTDDRSTNVCVVVGEALANGDAEQAERALDGLADATLDGRTKRVEGILHYAFYILLSYRMGPQDDPK